MIKERGLATRPWQCRPRIGRDDSPLRPTGCDPFNRMIDEGCRATELPSNGCAPMIEYYTSGVIAGVTKG